MAKIAFIGGGNMASSLIGGLLKQGFSAADLIASDPLQQNRERLAGE
ncbi:MAG TPA: pyrroline-5-carboxylate reductase, partial [Porticoccaceae bacterium]|nr:pyrroline-5-carboxylate reductase [Porticoccaceae bacterium]